MILLLGILSLDLLQANSSSTSDFFQLKITSSECPPWLCSLKQSFFHYQHCFYPIELLDFIFFSSQHSSLLAFFCLFGYSLTKFLRCRESVLLTTASSVPTAGPGKQVGLDRYLLNDLAWRKGPAGSGIYLSAVHSEHLIFFFFLLVTSPSTSSKNQPFTHSQFTRIKVRLIFFPLCLETEW